jgi:hypothetical protein
VVPAQVDQVVPVASRIVQRDPVVPVELVLLVEPVVLVVLVVLVVPADLVVPAGVAPVAVAPVRAEQRLVRLEGREAVLHVAANPREPSVKSLTTWKRPRWAVYVCPEEMATASDFRVVQA